MAERRMFARSIIDSDAFLDMSASAQALYFHLGMRADDDGFVNNPKKIQRMVGAADDDMRILIAKRYVIAFESGVLVIKHWKIHNYIQNDRYKPTLYKEEMALLVTKDNKSYTEANRIHDVSKLDTQVRLGKPNVNQPSIGESEEPKRQRFYPPSLDDVSAYCKERHNKVDPEAFIAFYESKGWMIGKNKMTSWKNAVLTWEKRENYGGAQRNGKTVIEQQYNQREYNASDYDGLTPEEIAEALKYNA